MQQSASPSGGDGGSKAKLLALLDRARVNRGLQPGEDAVHDDSPPIKAEPTPVNSNGHHNSQPPGHEKLQCTCGHSHQSTDAHQQEEQASAAPRQRNRASNDTAMAFNDSSAAHTTVVSTGTSRLNSNSHPRTYSSTETQSAGETAKQTDTKDKELLSTQLGRSSTPKPRIADLTGGNRMPKLQELRPLAVPRTKTHPLEEKTITLREAPSRAQPKQPRNHPPSANTTEALKNMTRLSVDEYEDSELHGDFQHMLHILIPANATTALLERRGQPIQSISRQTGCTLSIREPEASPFKDDRLLRIYGKAKCISLAQRLVIAYIRAYRAGQNDPNYMDLSDETPPVALPATSITKAMSVAVTSGKKGGLEIASPFNWIVQRENVGRMMGMQGTILASIRRDTGAAIYIDKNIIPGTTERRVVLTGSVDSITAAVKEIKNRAGGHPEVAASVTHGRLGQYFAIPFHAAGFLIGPQGSTAKLITERTGARLQIPSAEDSPLGSVNRILHMQGTPKQAEHAVRVVSAKLRDYLASPKCPRALTPVSTGRKGDKVTIKALLPSRICGFMLDQRGKLIREISDKSGAHTFFLAPHDDENRICVFTGDMSCVLRAQRLVLQIIAGDAILSKLIAPPRKRNRSQRDEEEEDYTEEYTEYVDDEASYDDDEVVEDYYEEEYEEVPRLPVRRQSVRREPLRRPQHNYDHENYHEEEDAYSYDDVDALDEAENRPRQCLTRRKPREYIEDDYAVDEYDDSPDERTDYAVARPRFPKRQAVIRRQTFTVRRGDYDDGYGENESENDCYEDGGDGEYEHSLVARKQVIRRRPDDIRQAVLRPGRKVQMLAPKVSPREGRPRMVPSDRRRSNSSTTRPRHRNGSGNMRQGAPRGGRGGRGNGRPTSSRGRGNGNKRRRQ